jgi:exopolysaccharide biosynthesis protein
MKRFLASGIILVVILLHVSQNLDGQIPGFKKIKWEREKIAPGLVWKSSHCTIYDTVPQNINILIINTSKRRMSICYDYKKNTPVSRQAADAKAIAAVNAGFFNIAGGGSVTYIKTGGIISEPDTAVRWKPGTDRNGSILIDADGGVTITGKMSNSWYDSHKEYPDVLVTGPLLLSDKNKVALSQSSLVKTKHPRSIIGVINDSKVILVTLDGRTDHAAGMTLQEVADLMVSLKCSDALNLDGGGSTTMWINGKPFSGVVNMPSDNKKFDHEGERAVSDILIIK